MDKKDLKKFILEVAFFLVVMIATWQAFFSSQDFGEIGKALQEMEPLALLGTVILSVLFVCGEGYMIWYLMHGLGERCRLHQCFIYSFVGFFFSGITPSATGGQPMQLYCMKKDGGSMSHSSIVLLTVAIAYKTVLVAVGVGILVFWFHPLRTLLGNYFWLYLLGLSLNVIVVTVLYLVMFSPGIIGSIVRGGERLLVKCHLMKPAESRQKKIDGFIEEYRQALEFFKKNKGKLLWILIVTFFQRSTLFVLTYVIYRGFGLTGTDGLEVILLQASVYVAVDMLPIPGAQGITELMYSAVFLPMFTSAYLMPSMMVNRGVSFYLLMLISLAITIVRVVSYKRVKTKDCRMAA